MTEETTPGERAGWHLDKRVPIALIAAISLQTLAGGFWLGTLATRVSSVEQWQANNGRIEARLSVLENQSSTILRALERVEDRLEERP